MKEYYNYQYYILNNMNELNLSQNQTLVLMFLRYYNETSQEVDFKKIGDNLGIELLEVAQIIEGLLDKKYIALQTSNGYTQYNTNVIYKIEENKANAQTASIFKKFESGFNRIISQHEVLKINELIQSYDIKLIEYALREALIHDVKKLEYVEKILINWKKKNLTASDYENGNN